jgi:hypothetical protein
MPPFQYEEPRSTYAGTIARLLAQRGDPAAQAALRIAEAEARAAEQRGNIIGGTIQTLSQIPAQWQQQQQQQKTQALQTERTRAEIADLKAQADQRAVAARKAQAVEDQNAYVDRLMKEAFEDDPATGVSSFNRQRFEKGLVDGGQGHLYPDLSETLDKLDASTAKRAKEGRTALADTLIGIERAGYTQLSVLTGAAYLKKNRYITDEHLQPILEAMADDPSPEHIKGFVTRLGEALPEYRAAREAEDKRQADLAKTQAETARITAETRGTIPATPAQAEIARHNQELERIAGLTAGRAEATQRETERHNRATEAKDTGRLVQVMGPGGTPIWVRENDAVGQPAAQAPRAVTGQERQSLAYYNRAKEAVETLTAPDKSGKSLEQRMASLGQQAQLQYAPNLLQSGDQQAYRQAQRAFTEARLRKESGAAIPTAEYTNDSKTYFVQPGDTDATIEQKRKARQTVLDGLKFGAGKAYAEFYGEDQKPPLDQVRADGTAKGDGFFGVLKRPDGKVSTEISIGVPIDGKETEIPTLVPTLTRGEVTLLLVMKEGGKVPDSIVRKAVDYAKQRIKAGKSPFAQAGEQQRLYPDLARATTTGVPKEGTEGAVNGIPAVWKTVNGVTGWYAK